MIPRIACAHPTNRRHKRIGFAERAPGRAKAIGFDRPTGWHSAAASALAEASKKPTISRAKRSAAMPGWAGALGRYRVSIAQTNCTLAVYHARVWSRNVAGRTAGEPCGVSGVCARVGAPAGCRTALRVGREGAFRVSAPPQTLVSAAPFWRAARYATAPARSHDACPTTSDQRSKRDGVNGG